MKILFLTQIVPYPPDSGPKVKTWQVLRYLHERGHQITLVSFVRAEEEKHLDAIRQLGIQVYPVAMRRNRVMDMIYWLQSNLSGQPFLIERDNLKPMRELVTELMKKEAYDAVHADQLTMTQFFLDLEKLNLPKRPIRIFDAHNATWMIVKRMGGTSLKILNPILNLESKRVKEYEGRVVRDFEWTLAVTDIDRDLLLEAVQTIGGKPDVRDRILSIPITVDSSDLMPVRRNGSALNIMTLGTLHYPPNADGIRWFIQEVFPRVQSEINQVTLSVIGKNPPADFLQIAQQSQGKIEVTGYVEDLTPYLERACLMVVPVRVGSGMRVRILEAFARGIPVVTTTIGLEGIDARPGQDVLVADEPEDFAREVIRLAKDPLLQERLANNGRALIEQVYDRKIALQKMDRVYS
jgi:glycosyltransferase involved in cell wall biosynthesis